MSRSLKASGSRTECDGIGWDLVQREAVPLGVGDLHGFGSLGCIFGSGSRRARDGVPRGLWLALWGCAKYGEGNGKIETMNIGGRLSGKECVGKLWCTKLCRYDSFKNIVSGKEPERC
jgi:hypothetical protein